MQELSFKEKQQHHTDVKKYLDFINENFGHILQGFKLMHLAYTVPVDDVYFYFDYPYLSEKDPNGKVVDDIVVRLNNDKKLKRWNELLFESFHENQSNYLSQGANNLGYTYYHYDKKGSVYNIYKKGTNLLIGNPEREDIFNWYLTLLDSSIYLNEFPHEFQINHCSSVDINDTQTEIFTICKTNSLVNGQTGTIVISVVKEHSDVGFDLKNADGFVAQLNNTIFFLLENYFNSPILDKLFQEARKSSILAYQHSIANLRLYDCLDNIKDGIEKQDSSIIREEFDDFFIRMKILRLLHFSIFQVEYLQSGYSDLNKTKAFDLANKSILEILRYFDEEVNIKQVRIEWVISEEAQRKDYIPKGENSIENMIELYDVQLILWNIWTNACIKANREKVKFIKVIAEESGDKLKVTFENMGRIENKYINYLESNAAYPDEKDPYKPYRGLEIIRDIWKKNSTKWHLEVELVKHNEVDFTRISLTL